MNGEDNSQKKTWNSHQNLLLSTLFSSVRSLSLSKITYNSINQSSLDARQIQIFLFNVLSLQRCSVEDGRWSGESRRREP
ncbi:hypothetical protein F0562_031845 [Nyssa sinensis]|uniref:Uncharacterized protein n=1 Tax=Nyssa sinensis TaxID=561372 RepID=A0A5J5AVK7_9ASTE|nr:hypothetical protein F0562_031845 [Nyssa sinensis]